MLTQYPRFPGPAFRAVLLFAGLALLMTVPHGASAKDGGSGGSGSGHSGSDNSGSSGSGGRGSGDDGGSDHSGTSSNSGKGNGGGDDHGGGGDDSGHGGKQRDGEERQHTYDGGWRAQIRNGRYQVFDPAGRVVINRKVRMSDYAKF